MGRDGVEPIFVSNAWDPEDRASYQHSECERPCIFLIVFSPIRLHTYLTCPYRIRLLENCGKKIGEICDEQPHFHLQLQ